MKKEAKRTFQINTWRLPAPVSAVIALVADLHNGDPAALLAALGEIRPDLIAIAGDLMERRDGAEAGGGGAYGPWARASFLRAFAAQPGYKVLLCHHPEYYEPLLRPLDIQLVLSGHAHGGQIRLGGQGLFAPGQGFFPRYTAGLYEGRLLVSRGLRNNTCLPRVHNPLELVVLRLG